MSRQVITDLPTMSDFGVASSLLVRGATAFISHPQFVGAIDLDSGRVKWGIERTPTQTPTDVYDLPRWIGVSGLQFWLDQTGTVLVELSEAEDGGLRVSARMASTGLSIWERHILIPDAADWAESKPAWPGAQTEELDAYLACVESQVVVCTSRRSRCKYYYSSTVTVDTLPTYACQLDAVRLDLNCGTTIWQKSIPDTHVGILERRSFSGIHANGGKVGVIDWETGTNRLLHESSHQLGWPVSDGSLVAVPWHSKAEVGVIWLNEFGEQRRQASWSKPRAKSTCLHKTDAGLALQVDDQSLYWIGREVAPLWNVRVKPYIYKVCCALASDVFIGTDGRGGWLHGFDPTTGKETLKFKPTIGGAGTLEKIPSLDALVAMFWTSRRYGNSGQLFVLSLRDREQHWAGECQQLLATWDNGVLCTAGQNDSELVVVDVREFMP